MHNVECPMFNDQCLRQSSEGVHKQEDAAHHLESAEARALPDAVLRSPRLDDHEDHVLPPASCHGAAICGPQGPLASQQVRQVRSEAAAAPSDAEPIVLSPSRAEWIAPGDRVEEAARAQLEPVPHDAPASLDKGAAPGSG